MIRPAAVTHKRRFHRAGALLLTGLVVLLTGLALLGTVCRRRTPPPEVPGDATSAPRLVSLAPSTTEALFALGLGDQVVGVSRFCDFPPEVADRARIGGLQDVNVEAVVRLRPDLVVAPRSHERARESLTSLGIEVLTLDQETLPQIFDAMWILGEALDRADVAAAWLGEMERLLAAVAASAPPEEERPRVLVCVGRSPGALERIYVAGPGTFYHDVLVAVGARNAYAGDIPYPMIGVEGLLRMDPDWIVELLPETPETPTLTASQALAQWHELDALRAVSANRVVILTEGWGVRPGPRIGFLIARLAELVRPVAERHQNLAVGEN